MASNIPSDALSGNEAVTHLLAVMPRKARPHPKPKRRPTYIKAWRKHRGLTLVQMADAIEATTGVEISDSQLSRIERGEQPYSQDLLEAIADVLSTDAASLIMRDPLVVDPIWSLWETVQDLEPAQQKQAAELIAVLKRTGTEG
jgi:transcriptional regulator with XRE-family HTH domain